MESAINLRQLQYFARIVETGNITRAAEQLYVAQPALGLQIRHLRLRYHLRYQLRYTERLRASGGFLEK